MNYVKMMGGLGNQLFEYTFARYLEKKTGKAVRNDNNWPPVFRCFLIDFRQNACAYSL